MMSTNDEKELQQTFAWARSGIFASYNRILGYYQAQACLDFARGDSLLDLPCGDGTVTKMLSSRFDRVVGVDASRAHLEKAKSRLPLSAPFLYRELIGLFYPDFALSCFFSAYFFCSNSLCYFR